MSGRFYYFISVILDKALNEKLLFELLIIGRFDGCWLKDGGGGGIIGTMLEENDDGPICICC